MQIGGILTNTCAWYHKPDENTREGAQIDLIIDRADNIINLCEIKYARGKYILDKRELDALKHKREIFMAVTHTRKAVHLTMITPEGLKDNGYAHEIQSQVILDDLF